MSDATVNPCPVCGYLVFDEPPGSYAICPICFWDDDRIQLGYPLMAGGANSVSLYEAQQQFMRDAFGCRWPGVAAFCVSTMKRTLRLSALLASVLLAPCLQGCMTIETLAHSDETQGHGFVYSGVRKDFRGAFGDEYGPDAAILWPISICDMPLSAAADTLVLPYTIPKAHSVQARSESLDHEE